MIGKQYVLNMLLPLDKVFHCQISKKPCFFIVLEVFSNTYVFDIFRLRSRDNFLTWFQISNIFCKMISCIVLYSRDLDRSIQNVSKTEEGAPEFSANFLKAKKSQK